LIVDDDGRDRADSNVLCVCPAGWTTSNASVLEARVCSACPIGFTTLGQRQATTCAPCAPTPWPSDPQFITAVNATPALAYHVATTLDVGTAGILPKVCVDAIVYFERVRAQGSFIVEMTCFFKILTPGLADVRDMLLVWRAPANETRGMCDDERSLHTCLGLKAPTNASKVYNLTRQLAWAYTSVEDPNQYLTSVAAYRTVGRVARDKDSFVLSFPSAGTGPYFLSLFSHKLQRTIAQIDYVPSRLGDCTPGTPDVHMCVFPQDRGFQMYGPLHTCPAGTIQDYTEFSGCKLCAQGTYATVAGLTSCVSCPYGTYQPESGSTFCFECEDKYTTLFSSATQQKDCVSCVQRSLVLEVAINSILGCERVVISKTTTAEPTTTRVQTTPPQTTPVPVPAVCGDGILVFPEACEMGPPPPPSQKVTVLTVQAVTNLTLVGASLMCTLECRRTANRCGDSVRAIGVSVMKNLTARALTREGDVMMYEEECDDGNLINGDGCSLNCKVERGYYCVYSKPDICRRRCGNGVLEADNDEMCDDGNDKNGDGCSWNCTVMLVHLL
jgi:cysteine-rich repeat protein